MVLPLVPIAAQIARVVAVKGIKAAIKKFGKDAVKKENAKKYSIISSCQKKLKTLLKQVNLIEKQNYQSLRWIRITSHFHHQRSQAGIRARQSEKKSNSSWRKT